MDVELLLPLLLGLFLIFAGFFIWILFRLKRRKRYDLTKITMKDIDEMSGHEFEDYLYVLFSALGFEETYQTKKSRDFGADLVFLDREQTRVVVQAKRYSEKLGLTAVQEVYTAGSYYQAEKALVITTTEHISEPCRKLAAAAKVRIIAREELEQLIRAFKRGQDEKAIDIIERVEETPETTYRESLEIREQTRGLIKAGEYFYRES